MADRFGSSAHKFKPTEFITLISANPLAHEVTLLAGALYQGRWVYTDVFQSSGAQVIHFNRLVSWLLFGWGPRWLKKNMLLNSTELARLLPAGTHHQCRQRCKGRSFRAQHARPQRDRGKTLGQRSVFFCRTQAALGARQKSDV